MSGWDDFLASGDDGSGEEPAGPGGDASDEELAVQEAAMELVEAEMALAEAQHVDFDSFVVSDASDVSDVADAESALYAEAVGAELEANAQEFALELISDDTSGDSHGDSYGDSYGNLY